MKMAKIPYTNAAEEPSAMRESIVGARLTKVLKPDLKYLPFTMKTGMVSRNWVKAKFIAFASPWKNPGRGQPSICPIAMYTRGIEKANET
jgi:hypothetical protein